MLTPHHQARDGSDREAGDAGSGPVRPYVIALVFGTLGVSVCIFFDNLDKRWSYVRIDVGFSLCAAADLVEQAKQGTVSSAPRVRESTLLHKQPVRAWAAARRLSAN